MRTSYATTSLTREVVGIARTQNTLASVQVECIIVGNEVEQGHTQQGWLIGVIHEVAIAEPIHLIHEVISRSRQTIFVDGLSHLFTQLGGLITQTITQQPNQV